MSLIVVKAAYDSDAKVWFVEHSDVPGLNLEAPSLERLRELIPGALLDLLEVDGEHRSIDMAVEVIAHAHTRVRSAAA